MMAALVPKSFADAFDRSDEKWLYDTCCPAGVIHNENFATTTHLMNHVMSLRGNLLDDNLFRRICQHGDILSLAVQQSTERHGMEAVEAIHNVQLALPETRCLMEEYQSYKNSVSEWNVRVTQSAELLDLRTIMMISELHIVSNRRRPALLPYASSLRCIIEQGTRKLVTLRRQCNENKDAYVRGCNIMADFLQIFGGEQNVTEGRPSSYILHRLLCRQNEFASNVDPDRPETDPCIWLRQRFENDPESDQIKLCFEGLLEIVLQLRHETLANVLTRFAVHGQLMRVLVKIGEDTMPQVNDTPNFNQLVSNYFGAPNNFMAEPFIYDTQHIVKRFRAGVIYQRDTVCSDYNFLTLFNWKDLIFDIARGDAPTLQNLVMNSEFPDCPANEREMFLERDGNQRNMLAIVKEAFASIIASRLHQVQFATAYQKLFCLKSETRKQLVPSDCKGAVLSVASGVDHRGIPDTIKFGIMTQEGCLHPAHHRVAALQLNMDEVTTLFSNVADNYNVLLARSTRSLQQLGSIMFELRILAVVIHPTVFDRQTFEKIIRFSISLVQGADDYAEKVKFAYSSIEATTCAAMTVHLLYSETLVPVNFIQSAAIATGWMATDKAKAMTALMRPIQLNGVEINLMDMMTWPVEGLRIKKKSGLSNAFLSELHLINLFGASYGCNAIKKSIIHCSGAWILSNDYQTYDEMRQQALQGENEIYHRMTEISADPNFTAHGMWLAIRGEPVLDGSMEGQLVMIPDEPFTDYPDEISEDSIRSMIFDSVASALAQFCYAPDFLAHNCLTSVYDVDIPQDGTGFTRLANVLRGLLLSSGGAKSVLFAALVRQFRLRSGFELWKMAMENTKSVEAVHGWGDAQYKQAWTSATTRTKNDVILYVLAFSIEYGLLFPVNVAAPLEAIEMTEFPAFGDPEQINLFQETLVIQIINFRLMLATFSRYKPDSIYREKSVDFTWSFLRFSRKHLYFMSPLMHYFKICRPSLLQPGLNAANTFETLEHVFGGERTVEKFQIECDLIYECDEGIDARFTTAPALTMLLASGTGFYGQCSEFNGNNLASLSTFLGQHTKREIWSNTPFPITSLTCVTCNTDIVNYAEALMRQPQGNEEGEPHRLTIQRWNALGLEEGLKQRLMREVRGFDRLLILEKMKELNYPQQFVDFVTFWDPPQNEEAPLPLALYMVTPEVCYHKIMYKSHFGFYVPFHYGRKFYFMNY